jgi:hypothetical protein
MSHPAPDAVDSGWARVKRVEKFRETRLCPRKGVQTIELRAIRGRNNFCCSGVIWISSSLPRRLRRVTGYDGDPRRHSAPLEPSAKLNLHYLAEAPSLWAN